MKVETYTVVFVVWRGRVDKRGHTPPGAALGAVRAFQKGCRRGEQLGDRVRPFRFRPPFSQFPTTAAARPRESRAAALETRENSSSARTSQRPGFQQPPRREKGNCVRECVVRGVSAWGASLKMHCGDWKARNSYRRRNTAVLGLAARRPRRFAQDELAQGGLDAVPGCTRSGFEDELSCFAGRLRPLLRAWSCRGMEAPVAPTAG